MFLDIYKGALDSLKKQSGFTLLFENRSLPRPHRDRVEEPPGREGTLRGHPHPGEGAAAAAPAAGPGAAEGEPGSRGSVGAVGRYTSRTWLR